MSATTAPAASPSGERSQRRKPLETRRPATPSTPAPRPGIPVWVYRISWYLLCGLLAVTMLVPLVWMISIALKSDGDIMALPPEFLPTEFRWSNFIEGPRRIGFVTLLMNTVVVSALSVLGSVVSSMLAGYAISRINFRGRQAWFYIFVFSMFVPAIVTLIPIQQLFIKLNMMDTWWPLILPAWFGNPLFIFLARQFFASIPRSLDESAMVDGAGHLRIFLTILLPLTKPLWITMTILAFQASWNDFLNPLIYLNTPEKQTLSLGMANFIGGLTSGTTPVYNFYMASNLWFMMPTLVLFFFAQRYFMMGLGSLGMTHK